MADADERNELFVVVLDKKNLAIANFEFGSICHFHRLIANGTAKHPNRVGRIGLTFHILVNLEGNVSFDVTLSALAFPNRSGVGHRSLKNEFRLLNELLKSRCNHRRR